MAARLYKRSPRPHRLAAGHWQAQAGSALAGSSLRTILMVTLAGTTLGYRGAFGPPKAGGGGQAQSGRGYPTRIPVLKRQPMLIKAVGKRSAQVYVVKSCFNLVRKMNDTSELIFFT